MPQIRTKPDPDPRPHPHRFQTERELHVSFIPYPASPSDERARPCHGPKKVAERNRTTSDVSCGVVASHPSTQSHHPYTERNPYIHASMHPWRQHSITYPQRPIDLPATQSLCRASSCQMPWRLSLYGTSHIILGCAACSRHVDRSSLLFVSMLHLLSLCMSRCTYCVHQASPFMNLYK
jgi:hypothetical protein